MPSYDNQLYDPPAPVAQITIECPKSGLSVTKVRMLIDSGADITLLPKPSVHATSLESAEIAYEVVSFDGTASTSEAVLADVIFRGKRFKGRYLVLEAEIGILGRDILNYLNLVLDGPSLEWHSR